MRQKPVLAATILVAKPLTKQIKYKVGALEESANDELEEQQFPQ